MWIAVRGSYFFLEQEIGMKLKLRTFNNISIVLAK